MSDVCRILKNIVVKTTRSVKNSKELALETSESKTCTESQIDDTLDVVSLFTNIPKDLVINAINKKWTIIKKFTTLPKVEFTKGLLLVLDNCTFQYNGVFYKQTFGAPMGSPSSPIFADLILEMLEEDVIKN